MIARTLKVKKLVNVKSFLFIFGFCLFGVFTQLKVKALLQTYHWKEPQTRKAKWLQGKLWEPEKNIPDGPPSGSEFTDAAGPATKLSRSQAVIPRRKGWAVGGLDPVVPSSKRSSWPGLENSKFVTVSSSQSVTNCLALMIQQFGSIGSVECEVVFWETNLRSSWLGLENSKFKKFVMGTDSQPGPNRASWFPSRRLSWSWCVAWTIGWGWCLGEVRLLTIKAANQRCKQARAPVCQCRVWPRRRSAA
jgi:hypothetical protein